MREQQQDAYEDDDVVDTVGELGWEMVADGAHNELSCCGLDRAFTHVVEERRAKVARHNDHGILEVHRATLTIG